MSLVGSVTPPGDKSISHRVALFSLLARGACGVENFSPCADCASTLNAVRALGGRVESDGDTLVVHGAQGELSSVAVDCGNSGTTMRLLSGLLAGRPGRFSLDGDESLRKRPMARVADPLGEMGAEVSTTDGRPPLGIEGRELKGRRFDLAVASAQLKSALLLAGLQAEGETLVREPHLSRDHTELLFKAMGADLSQADGGWLVRRSGLTMPASLRVPGDISAAAFMIVAALIIPGSRVVCEGVGLNPTRTGPLTVLQRMGADLLIEQQGSDPEPWGRVEAAYTPGLKATEVLPAEIPLLVDEVPILALAASQAEGATIMRSVGELRVKESDRLAAITSQLGAMGARLREDGDDLVIEGPTPLETSEEYDSLGDHRIAMTLAVAGLLNGALPKVAQAGCAAVSYPDFYRDLEDLSR
ncbi:MAG: 3-phosphoshikimate 1-carboxyvinyltransferase [Desulfarculaceae bacterium]|nr:3-phosphoshikimate 1-carboxyvinyltransferase [Desulfarculaceae bacterium]MCF8071654.1 3-phosphoshikimate 1-carboxyvinyltransferase [Desulfarculaceae bacterium]MCF8102499.1 3-phosphoshikimate 1-carboxyvinyltransferase [Desulfarculaceae bacterium]MCF8114933.1 3-phosphoshikimate 1-carboxyvinyltransferase [Desulfarculaceae bacterium]